MHVTFTSIESEPRPPPRCSHAATALEGGIIVLGGGVYREHRFKHYADAWLLEAATATWRELPLSDDFVARRGHSAVHDVARDRLIVFGGARDAEGDSDPLVPADDSLCVLDVERDADRKPIALAISDAAATGAPPPPRRAHACALVGNGEAMVVYGGFAVTREIATPEALRDTILEQSAVYVLDLATLAWSRLGPATLPPLDAPDAIGDLEWRAARGVGMAACAAAGDAIVIAGGNSSTLGLAGGVYALKLRKRNDGGWDESWTVVRGPGPRCGDEIWDPRFGAAAAAVADRYVVVFGGTRNADDDEADASPCDLSDVLVLDVAATLENAVTPTSGSRRARVRSGAVRQPVWLPVRCDGAPAPRNSATLTAVETVGGETALVLIGGGQFGSTYFDDAHLVRVLDAPAAPRRPSTLAAMAEAAVAAGLDEGNVASIAAFADARGCGDLRRACLRYVQRCANPLFGGSSAPDGDADTRFPDWDQALASPALARDLRRALDGL